MRDPAMYGGSHGPMSSDWHWQQQQHQQQRQQQLMSSFPPHMQHSQMYHRMQQHHQHQQAMNAMRQQQHQAAMAAAMQRSGNRGGSDTPTSGSPGGMMDQKASWHEQNSSTSGLGHKGLPPKMHHHSDKSLSSPKPQVKHHLQQEIGMDSKVPPGSKGVPGLSSDATKRSLPDWSNCVEGTKPQLMKRRKLYSVHCGKFLCCTPCLTDVIMPQVKYRQGMGNAHVRGTTPTR